MPRDPRYTTLAASSKLVMSQWAPPPTVELEAHHQYLWRVDADAPQKLEYLWRILVDAPQIYSFLWRIQEHAPQIFKRGTYITGLPALPSLSSPTSLFRRDLDPQHHPSPPAAHHLHSTTSLATWHAAQATTAPPHRHPHRRRRHAPVLEERPTARARARGRPAPPPAPAPPTTRPCPSTIPSPSSPPSPPRGTAPFLPSPSPPHLHTRCLVKCQTQFSYRISMICY